MAINTNEFFLVSYLTEDQIRNVITTKLKNDIITRYAYIFHDKDVYDEDTMSPSGFHSKGELKTPHFHIYLKLKNYRKRDEVYRWFNKPIYTANTFIDEVRSTTSVLKYLTHESDLAVAMGKYIYDRNSIVSYNIDFDDFGYQNDKSAMILQDIINGLSCYTLAIKYGREFTEHIFQYEHIVKISTGMGLREYQTMLKYTPQNQEEINQNFYKEISQNEN